MISGVLSLRDGQTVSRDSWKPLNSTKLQLQHGAPLKTTRLTLKLKIKHLSVGQMSVFQSCVRFEVFMMLCLLSLNCLRLFAVVIYVLAYNGTVTTATVLTTNPFQVPADVQAVKKAPTWKLHMLFVQSSRASTPPRDRLNYILPWGRCWRERTAKLQASRVTNTLTLNHIILCNLPNVS